MQNISLNNNTIVALSTPKGVGAIAIVRLSGEDSIDIVNSIFFGKNIKGVDSHTIHFGTIRDGDTIIDEVLVSVFKGRKSFTGENSIEISIHASSFIIEKVISLCIDNGARYANPGEFSQRAFLNGKLDLVQAESIADLIASESEGSHALAINQLRGNVSSKIKNLRQELIDFAALLELELDFSEEDVEFADRTRFFDLLNKIGGTIQGLIKSFKYGNAIKNGIPVIILGNPNVGKSTLLNTLLDEDKAIVSEIEGTTRDLVEDILVLDGIEFRFIDTAGLRKTEDKIELIGINMALNKLKQAKLILYLADIDSPINDIVDRFAELNISNEQEVLILLNKSDKIAKSCTIVDMEEGVMSLTKRKCISISAKDGINVDLLKENIISLFKNQGSNQEIITNIRHYEALSKAKLHLIDVVNAFKNNVPSDLIAQDVRQVLYYMGLITGEIATDDLLDSVFTRFCIGK